MNTRLLSRVLAVALLLVPAAVPAQEPTRRETPSLSEADFQLHRYSAQQVDAANLYRTLVQLFGRQLNFPDRRVDNLTLLEESLVIYETPDRAETILAAAARLDVGEVGDAAARPQAATVYEPSQMELQSYVPRFMEAGELAVVASEIYTKHFIVGGERKSAFIPSGHALLVYAPRPMTQEIVARLRQLDESQQPADESQESLEVVQIRPRFASPQSLFDAVAPFRLFRSNTRDNHPQNQVPNLTLIKEQGVLLVRDVPERVAEIRRALADLDRPAPQCLLVCQVLRGTDGAVERPAAAALQEQLRVLLPYRAYEVAANGMLRASAVAGSLLSIEMDAFGIDAAAVPDGEGRATLSIAPHFLLELAIGSYDEQSGSLGLSHCELNWRTQHGSRRLFQTTTSLERGEQAVLGVAGAEPLFLVVQVLPTSQPDAR